MRVLVTGASGFVGTHLIKELTDNGHKVIPVVEPGEQFPNGHPCDIRDEDALAAIVRNTRPDAAIHLAGISYVPTAWEKPKLVIDVNFYGTINLLESFRLFSDKARILVITSSEVYGRDGGDEHVTEESPLRPNSLYGVTKVSADQATRLFADKYGMHTMTARPENHTGPGQSPRFVTSSFASQLARKAADNDHSPMEVGNLESMRDFTDVRDVVRAYRLLIEKGKKGHAYNIASGVHTRIQVVLDHLMEISGCKVETVRDEDLYRPTDESPHFSIEKIKKAVGWEAQIPLKKTFEDLYKEVVRRME